MERAILDGTEQGVIAVLTLAGVSGMMFWQEPTLAAIVFAHSSSWLDGISLCSYIQKNWRCQE